MFCSDIDLTGLQSERQKVSYVLNDIEVLNLWHDPIDMIEKLCCLPVSNLPNAME